MPLDALKDADCDELILKVDERHQPVFSDEYSVEEWRAVYRYFFSRRPQKLPPSLKNRIINLYDPMADRSTRFPDHLRFCINIYVGCEHNCGYCYVNGYGDIASPHEKQRFETKLASDLEDLQRLGVPAAPLHISNSTDPLQSRLETRHRHTLFTLQQVARQREQFTSVVMLTKNPALLLENPYLSVISNPALRPLTIQVSCAFWRDEAREFYEPNAPSIQSRLEAIQRLTSHDIDVELRIDPLFPSTRIAKDVRLHEPLPHYGLVKAQTDDDIKNLVRFAKEAGLIKIVGKPLKVAISKRAQRAKDWFSQIYSDSYPNGKRSVQGGSWRFPLEYQHALITTVRNICETEGIQFQHCKHDVLERK